MPNFSLVRHNTWIYCFNKNLLTRLPESPRWLLNKGKIEKAENVLFRAAEVNGVNISKEKKTALRERMTEKTEVTNPCILQFFSTVKLLNKKLLLLLFFDWLYKKQFRSPLICTDSEIIGNKHKNISNFYFLNKPQPVLLSGL